MEVKSLAILWEIEDIFFTHFLLSMTPHGTSIRTILVPS